MPSKRSQAELRRLVEAAANEVFRLPRTGLWLCVDEVEASGNPPSGLRVWATLHFLADGAPFCCGEPNCHLGLMEDRVARVGDHVRRAMGLRQQVVVAFDDRLGARYHDGVWFHYHQTEIGTE